MFRMIGFISAATLLCLGPALAHDKAAQREAACTKKRTATEREICRDRDLTRRDGVLNDVYGELRTRLSKKDFRALRTEQIAWLKDRNRCGAKTRCIATKYEDRVAELEQMLENLAHPGKSHVEIGCDGPNQQFVNGECLTNGEPVGTAPDDDAQWFTQAFNDPGNKGRFTAYLRYGLPETDAIAFQSVCQAGSSGRFATTIASYDVMNMREGAKVTLEIAIENHNQSFDAEVYGTNLEEGVSGILFHPDLDDGLWEALASGNQLVYSIRGGKKATLTLRNSGSPVREFIDACQSMHTATNETADSGTLQLSSKNKTCNKWGNAKSPATSKSVTVTFVNKTDSHRAVMWLNHEGHPVDYAALNPGEAYVVKTYEGHHWMFTDGPGNCIEMFTATANTTHFDITASSPYFGPEHD